VHISLSNVDPFAIYLISTVVLALFDSDNVRGQHNFSIQYYLMKLLPVERKECMHIFFVGKAND
jgi:hypothetical protein